MVIKSGGSNNGTIKIAHDMLINSEELKFTIINNKYRISKSSNAIKQVKSKEVFKSPLNKSSKSHINK